MTYNFNEMLAGLGQRGGQDTVNAYNNFLQATNPYVAQSVRPGQLLPITGGAIPMPTQSLYAPQLEQSGAMLPNRSPMAGPVKSTTGGGYNPNSTAETAQKLAQERKDREDAMREWQKQWNEQKKKEQQDLRDRLAEIRAQGQENRITSAQEFEQNRKLNEENKYMSKEQVLMQLLASLGMF